VFNEKGIGLKETVEARKKKIGPDESWALLEKVIEIVVGKGKKILVYHPESDPKDEILRACLGRTGNLRAPALKVGDRMIIGFNPDMYEEYLA